MTVTTTEKLNDILDDNRTGDWVRDYFTCFTGRWFNQFAERDIEFGPRDFLAVSMLGVRVPARVSTWLMGEGAAEATRLLDDIYDKDIWDVPAEKLDVGESADDLWRLLKARSSQWKGKGANGVGPVIASKLMAAKRPGLIPVWDKHVRKALGLTEKDNYWLGWQQAMTPETVSRLEAIKSDAGVPDGVPLLRVADVSVWMYQYGKKDSPCAKRP